MSQINFLARSITNNLNRLFQHCHHAQTEQIYFNDAKISTVFLIPLHYNAAGHCCRLKRDDGIELTLTDHHSPRMLSEVSRQILNRLIKLKKLPDAPIAQVQSGILELPLSR